MEEERGEVNLLLPTYCRTVTAAWLQQQETNGFCLRYNEMTELYPSFMVAQVPRQNNKHVESIQWALQETSIF